MAKTTAVFWVIGAIGVVGAAGTAAQVPAPTPIPTLTPSPGPADVVPPTVIAPAPTPTAFPTTVPTPTPTPAILPIPTETPTARPTTPSPRPIATPGSRPSATPKPRASPSPQPSVTPLSPVPSLPGAAPTSDTAARVRPTPTPTPRAVTPEATEPLNWLPWLLGTAGLALLGVLSVRYRRDPPVEQYDEAAEPAAEPARDVAPPPARRTGAPWITLSLRPVRAGLNMVTAVADCEVTLANEGGAAAEQVRAALTLLAAHAGQDADIAGANAEPITRSVVPVFTLEPGERRTFRGVASAALDALPTMQAGGRDMLVPLVLLHVQHRDAQGTEHRISQAFVIGIERVDSPKLAPFWLDTTRMVEQVAARPSGATDRRRVA